MAPKLAGILRESGLLEMSFALALLLVLATIFTQGLKKKWGRAEIGVILGVAAAYILVFVRMAIPEERTHLIEYSIVGIFIYEALTERANHCGRVPVPALLAFLVTALLGILDECIQILLPNRIFDPLDILFNVFAGFMAIHACVVLAWLRRRGTK